MRSFSAIFFVLAIFLVANMGMASHIPVPVLPAESEFENTGTTKNSCGMLTRLEYMDEINKIFFVKYFLDGNKNPFTILKITESSFDAWVDNDQDGHIDEYFNSGTSLAAKYKTPCDAVK